MSVKYRFRWRSDLQRWQWNSSRRGFLLACKDCGAGYMGGIISQRCSECRLDHMAWLLATTGYALNRVAHAVRHGYLRPARDFACVDCGEPAKVYDHRDYSKPLDVQPVCHSCNNLRGSAKRIVVAHPRVIQ